MVARVAREEWDFDSIEDFFAEGGADYGEGAVVIGGTRHVSGLIPNSTKQAHALFNTALLQKWLNSGTKRVDITLPGTYAFAGGSDPQAICTVPSDTTVYIGPGVIIDNIAASFGLSKTMFINENALSNAIAVTELTHVIDNPAWTSTVTLNIGAAINPFAVGDYVYIRPAYTGGDTTGFFNYIYKVIGIDNSDANNKKVRYRMANGSSSYVPSPNGALICYQADANIRIFGEGKVRQSVQNRGSNIRGNISYQQTILNKILNGYIGLGLTESPGSCFAALANSFGSTIENGMSDNSTGFWLHGNCYGTRVLNVAGESKDDLGAIFTDGANTPLYDADGVTVNSAGDIVGIYIDFGKKHHRKASSQGISMISENNHLIDDVTIVNYHGEDIMGQPFHFGCGYGVNGTGRYGKITFKDGYYVPRRGRGLAYISNGAGGGSVTIDEVVFDNFRVPALPSADGNAGFQNAGAGIFNAANTTGSHWIKKIEITGGSEFNFDMGASGSSDVNAMYFAERVLVDEIVLKGSKIKASGSARVLNPIRSVGESSSYGIKRITIDDCVTDCPGAGFIQIANTAVAPEIHISKSRPSVAAVSLAFQAGAIPHNTRFYFADNDVSGFVRGLIYPSGTTAKTINLTYGGTKVAGWCFNPSNAQNITYNIRSTGGNEGTGAQGVGTSNTFNLYGNCADLQWDVTQIARVNGAILYNTNAAAGTLGQAGLVAGGGTGANSWKLLTDTTKAY
ncbi:hypothetical protein PL263_05210 [Methylomonas sp. EFPC3]|uniref:hypothetical protein n=1 Tax=Methylomonas sp. EFPC3 TaxID=3021710 RepID=UPI0024167237|nr:hypothetical protein [Methylomonas sp. EFPC3]WFP51429.1 hypothetical protein PL263_05210 [Methylomonas sp. EFPC3]